MTQVTVTLDLTYGDMVEIRKCSVERVINEAIRLGEHLESLEDDECYDAGANVSDLNAIKPTVRKLWFAVREQIMANMKEAQNR